MARKSVLIFITNPVEGLANPRLAEKLGVDKAVRLYEHLVDRVRNVTQAVFEEKYLYYSDFIPEDHSFRNDYYKRRLQQGHSTIERMRNSMNDSFQEGFGPVVLVFGDAPNLSEDEIRDAFYALKCHDAVVGPTRDGNLYLFGLRKPLPEVFDNYGPAHGLAQGIIDCLRDGKFEYHEMPTQNDLEAATETSAYRDLVIA